MRPFTGLLAGLVVVLAASSSAQAQAWVNEKGQLSLALRADYQTATGVWHGSTLVTGLNTQAVNSGLSVEYVPIDKLALMLTQNFNGARYTGPQTLPGNPGFALAHGSQDDGTFHYNPTDLDLDVRYQAYDAAITLTPALRARIPVTDYEQNGYAAAGIGLKEVGAGLQLGRYGLGTDKLVLQAGYMFTFVEKESGGGPSTEQYRVNRSDADVSLAYIFNEKFIAAVGAVFRYTHDGFDLEEYPMLASGDPLIDWHDPVMQVKYLAPTAVAAYNVTDELTVSARFAAIVWGRSASNAMTFGLNVGWSHGIASAD